jgi:glucosamine-6-phosphate deaminase
VDIQIHDSPEALGRAAATRAAGAVKAALAARGQARVIAATGASQFAFLDALRHEPGVDWRAVTFFHLDEYVGLPDTHPASFCRYLRERVVEPLHPGHFEFVNGVNPDPEAECARLEQLIQTQPIDVAFVGIGENGHLAFNDPPADFTTRRAYLVVNLDDACRQQQVGEGWFPSLDEVPRRAISMSVTQILAARELLVIVPDARKARAIHDCFDGPISVDHPASALQQHPRVTVFLDRPSASLLQRTATAASS